MHDATMRGITIFAFGLLGFGMSMSHHRWAETRVIPDATATMTADAAAMPAVAYRPGEPQLVPGQSTQLARAGNGHFNASVSVNGQPVEMMVDTGATVVALTVDDARRLGFTVDPAQFREVGSGASGPVRGVPVVLDDIAVEGRHASGVDAVVLEGLDRSLLGQSFLRRLDQVDITGDTMTLR